MGFAGGSLVRDNGIGPNLSLSHRTSKNQDSKKRACILSWKVDLHRSCKGDLPWQIIQNSPSIVALILLSCKGQPMIINSIISGTPKPLQWQLILNIITVELNQI